MLLRSVFDLLWLWLDHVAHLGTWLAWLEWSEQSIWLWNWQVGWHVRVWSWQDVGFAASCSELGLEDFGLAPLLSLLLSSLLVANDAFPLTLRVISWWHSLLELLEANLKDLLLLFLLLLQFEGLRLEHGELRDGCQHLARELRGPRLVLVDLLSDLEGGLPTIESLSPELLSKIADLLVDKLLLEESFLLVVETLLQDMDLGEQGLRIRILSLELLLVGVLLRVFDLLTQLLHLLLPFIKLVVELDDLIGQLWHQRDLVSHDLQLSLPLFELKLDHTDSFLPFSDLLLSIFEDVFLDVGLFIQDAKFIVSVNELDTHIVSTLTGMLILIDQVVHLILQRVDNKIQLVTMVDELTNS